MEPFMKPAKSEQRTARQRAHDALVEILGRGGAGRADGDGRLSGAGARPS